MNFPNAKSVFASTAWYALSAHAIRHDDFLSRAMHDAASRRATPDSAVWDCPLARPAAETKTLIEEPTFSRTRTCRRSVDGDGGGKFSELTISDRLPVMNFPNAKSVFASPAWYALSAHAIRHDDFLSRAMHAAASRRATSFCRPCRSTTEGVWRFKRPAAYSWATHSKVARSEERRVGKECVSTWRSRW